MAVFSDMRLRQRCTVQSVTAALGSGSNVAFRPRRKAMKESSARVYVDGAFVLVCAAANRRNFSRPSLPTSSLSVGCPALVYVSKVVMATF